MGVRKRCSKCSKTLVFAEKEARDAKQEQSEAKVCPCPDCQEVEAAKASEAKCEGHTHEFNSYAPDTTFLGTVRTTPPTNNGTRGGE